MKKVAIIIVFIFSLNRVYSQKYRPFDSTTVYATYYYYKVNSGCYVEENLKYFFNGYELNNGNVWLKVYKSGTSNWMGSSFNCAASYPGYISSFNNVFKGFLFNDTISKKVFFRSSWQGALPTNHIPITSNQNNNELIYNFNKTVGDSMYSYSIMSGNGKFKINSIDSILFSGKYHKRYLTALTPTTSPNLDPSFTEGIGSSIDPFEPFKANGFESGSKILCFASPIHTIAITSHTVFSNSNSSCYHLIMGVNEKSQNDVSIYPNPASDKLSIIAERFVSEKTEYELINLTGQLLLNGKLDVTNTAIDLKQLPNGLYFINFYTEGSLISCKKIIVSKN